MKGRYAGSFLGKFEDMIGNLMYFQVREKFQAQRANLFLVLMKPQDGISILDVGGGWGDFLARIKDRVQARFVIADIRDHTFRVQQKYGKYGFQFVLLEEDKPLPFRDKEFDIVISLSVIEHACASSKEESTLTISHADWASRSKQKQMQFADEIRRVGKRYFVQTPHKSFPIETHTWLPFANYLSHPHTISLVRYTDKYWLKKCGDVDWNLLGVKEMRALFPEAQIHVERFCALPKSIIAFTSRELA